ncbi:MAG: glycine--tRNA ligase [Nanoarchaeota archaeon]|nr:glycine--tRNA ligase [Nanoarchaeota archaeon]
MEEVAGFFKRKGIIFSSGSIYGGYNGFWDWGPLGVQIKRNVTNAWWKTFVENRDDVIGIDGSIITHPKVWKASGHVDGFTDPLVDCKKCKKRWRADNLVENATGKPSDGLKAQALDKNIKSKGIKCPSCKGELSNTKVFNLMFKTSVGPVETESSTAYLRPETAQSIFADFKPVLDSTRVKLPFGIAQIGKAFRNEISPRNFIFRDREFEQMEIEFFVHPKRLNNVPDFKQVENLSMNVLPEKEQKKNKPKTFKSKTKELFVKKIIKNKWQAYWIAFDYKWLLDMGIKPENLRIRQHLKDELSHYASDNWDIDYKYLGKWRELQGHADRSQYDLTQHEKHSGKKLSYFDEETGERVIPYVACEPSMGVERLILAIILDAYKEEKERKVLKLKPLIAPYQIAVFPLVSKDKLPEKAEQVYQELRKTFRTFYDDSGSIGRRYRRQDESGTPYCVTIDYQTMKDDTVTVRDRDSMKQERVKIKELAQKITGLMN